MHIGCIGLGMASCQPTPRASSLAVMYHEAAVKVESVLSEKDMTAIRDSSLEGLNLLNGTGSIGMKIRNDCQATVVALAKEAQVPQGDREWVSLGIMIAIRAGETRLTSAQFDVNREIMRSMGLEGISAGK